MKNIKQAFTNYIHRMIRRFEMPYCKGFEFAALRNALSKDNPSLHCDIFDQQLYQLQKLINICNLKEIKSIIDFGILSGTKIVFLKGIFLASKLYDDINLRITTDIDIVVQEKDLAILHTYFIANGYQYTGDPDLIKAGRAHHLCFNKKMAKVFDILVEVHTCIGSYDAFDTFNRLAFDKAQKEALLGFSPCILTDIDQIIHLFLHFTRHSLNISGDEHFNYTLPVVHLKDLYDAVSLMQKKQISFGMLDARIEETKVESGVYFALKVLDEIMVDLVPQDLLAKYRSLCGTEEFQAKFTFSGKKHQAVAFLSKSLFENLENALIKQPRELVLPCLDGIAVGPDKLVLFDYQDECFTCYATAFMLNGLCHFTFEFSKIEQLHALHQYIFVVHYRIARHGEKALFDKLQINFYQAEQICRVRLYNPWLKIDFDEIAASVRTSKSGYMLTIDWPVSHLQSDKIITYSMNSIGGENRCLTGETWDDFKSMKQFYVDKLC